MDTNVPPDLIGLADACRLVPSCRAGKRLNVRTLYRWIAAGKVRGWKRNGYWFVSRAEVLGLPRPAGPAPQPPAIRPETLAVLRRHGLM